MLTPVAVCKISCLLAVALLSFGCSRLSHRTYTEDDVRAFIQPGTTRDAIIEHFGTPAADDRSPKFEGGVTDVDEIIYYFLPSRRPAAEERSAFGGFQVRLKNQKAVEWLPTYRNVHVSG